MIQSKRLNIKQKKQANSIRLYYSTIFCDFYFKSKRSKFITFTQAFENQIARTSDFSDSDSADLQSVPTKRMVQREIMLV